jgi:hypothetical protein
MRILLPAFILFLLLTACKKNEEKNNCTLSKIELSSNNVVQMDTYEHDAQGRISKITSTSSGFRHFEYFTDSVVIAGNNKREVYLLDNRGLAISSRTTFFPNPNGLQEDYLYTYNVEGYLIEERCIFSQVYNGDILRDTAFNYYTILNGNVIMSNYTKATHPVYIEYSSDLLFQNNPVLNPFKSGMGSFLGKPLHNLISNLKDQDGNAISNTTYSIDPTGKVTATTHSYATNPVTTQKNKFYYDCN